jgi:hypothetical protein
MGYEIDCGHGRARLPRGERVTSDFGEIKEHLALQPDGYEQDRVFEVFSLESPQSKPMQPSELRAY